MGLLRQLSRKPIGFAFEKAAFPFLNHGTSSMTRNLAKHTLYATAILAMLSVCNSTHAQSFTALGDLPGGATRSLAREISADGSTIVGESNNAEGPEAFRWASETGMVGLGDISGGPFNSDARGVSADGSVIVGFGTHTSSRQEAFRWTSADGMVGLGFLGADVESEGLDVSANGSVVVGFSAAGSFTTDVNEAFRWTNDGGMVGLGDLAGGQVWSRARSVSGDGSVVAGQSMSASGAEAFRWTQDGGMVGLGDLAGGDFQSEVLGMSADGTTILGRSSAGDDNHTEAFRWTSETGMEGLGDFAGGTTESWASDSNANGSIIVGAGNSEAGRVAFIWDSANGMRSIQDLLTDAGTDLTGWRLASALAISENGDFVVGYGYRDGLPEAWVADLSFTAVPEPTSIVLLGFCALAFATRRRRFSR